MAVLGSMLLDPAEAIEAAVAKLNFEGSFYDPAHQSIFSALVKLGSERHRGTIDLITLSDALAKAAVLEEVGGRAYLSQLVSCVPTAANIHHYVDIVHQTAVLRRLIRTSSDVHSRCFEPQENMEELLDQIERDVLAVTGLTDTKKTQAVGDLIIHAIDHLDKLHTGDLSVVGLQTGFDDLDRLIIGLRPGDMFVLAARPSIGKTALALNIATNLALREKPAAVGFFSLEMEAKLLVLRLLCGHARVSITDVREGALSPGRWQEIMEAGQRLRSAPIYIDDTGSLDIMELRARARRMKREFDIQVIMIDYLQLMRANVGKNATRENEVARMSGGIKALAKELQVPILVLAQLNRQAEQPGQRPRLSHLRESGAIEQDADVVALLHRERDVEKDREGDGDQAPTRIQEDTAAELIVAKHRNGPTGIVPLTFLPAYTLFKSRSRIPDEDVPEV